MFQTKVVEAIKRHIFVFNNFFFRVVPSIRLCGKYCRARQVTDNNMHMNFMLDTSSYRHTLRIRNTVFPLQQLLLERPPRYYIYTVLPVSPFAYFQLYL